MPFVDLQAINGGCWTWVGAAKPPAAGISIVAGTSATALSPTPKAPTLARLVEPRHRPKGPQAPQGG